MIRLLVIIIIIILAILFSSNSVKLPYDTKRKRYIQTIIFLLILQSGLRNWAVGPDTYQYFRIFENAREKSWDDVFYNFFNFIGKDPFYDLFLKTFQVFSNSYQVYLIFVACIFMPALGYFIYKNTTRINHALLAFIIYMGNFYGFFSITGIRQTIATALVLWSYQCLKERNLWKFSVLVIVASLFHISALVFFLLYFVVKIKKTKLLFKLSVLGFPLILFFKNQLAVFFVNFADMEDRFGLYAQQYEKGGSFVLTALHVILAIWGVGLYNKMNKVTIFARTMYCTFALAIFFFPLQWVNPSAGRVAQYFTIIIMVWIPYLIDSSSVNKPKFRELMYFLSILILVSISLFAISLDEYKFFWQYMELPKGH